VTSPNPRRMVILARPTPAISSFDVKQQSLEKMTTTLDNVQSSTLFDILTHYETYAEIRDFRLPGTLKHYGPPFTSEAQHPSTSPALQTLVARFLLTLPGLNNLPEDWWIVQCHEIIENFEHSNLSESYDKGVIGSRKTLATAISALIEYPVRGTSGGFAEIDDANREYDTTKAEDLCRAFRDFMNECIYGTVLEEMIKKAGETDDLNDHDALTKAVHEFVLVK
jgi:PX-associated